jgi:hypothetical protein
VTSKGTVALFQGPGSMVWTFINRDTVYEYFGPFDIGLWYDVVVWGCDDDVGSVTLCAISLYHVLIFLSLLPYLYNRTALPQSTRLTSAVAAISILSSLFP